MVFWRWARTSRTTAASAAQCAHTRGCANAAAPTSRKCCQVSSFSARSNSFISPRQTYKIKFDQINVMMIALIFVSCGASRRVFWPWSGRWTRRTPPIDRAFGARSAIPGNSHTPGTAPSTRPWIPATNANSGEHAKYVMYVLYVSRLFGCAESINRMWHSFS